MVAKLLIPLMLFRILVPLRGKQSKFNVSVV